MISIVNYNGCEDTLECLRSIERSSYRDIVTVVIDNASSDASVDRIHQIWPDVEVIEMAENGGYAAAANRGIAYALDLGAEFCLLLNNDLVLHEDAILHLVQGARGRANLAAVGPKILELDQPSVVQSLGGTVNMRTGRAIKLAGGTLNRPSDTSPRRIDGYLEGSALLLVADAVRKIGVFDERYFMYYEDTDWSYRARRAGLELLLQPKAVVWHATARTTRRYADRLMYYDTRNRILFERRYATSAQWLAFWSQLPWHVVLTTLLGRQRNGGEGRLGGEAPMRTRAAEVFRGILDGAYGRDGIREDYRIE